MQIDLQQLLHSLLPPLLLCLVLVGGAWFRISICRRRRFSFLDLNWEREGAGFHYDSLRRAQFVCLFWQRHHGTALYYLLSDAIVVLLRWELAMAMTMKMPNTTEVVNSY